MEGSIQEPINVLDPFDLLKGLEDGREAMPVLGSVSRLYSPSEYRQLPTRKAAMEQGSHITSHRCGDLIPVGYAPEYGSAAQIQAMCTCGEHFNIHIRSVHRALLGEIASTSACAYYAPVKVNKHFPAPEPSTNRWPCPHIEKKLSAAYPKHYAAWVNMKKQIQTRASMYSATTHKMRIETPWFDKATGFAQFIIDVGLPDSDAETLRKKGTPGGFTRYDYEWADKGLYASARAKQPELARRFYALRSSSTKCGRHFYWDDFSSFLRSIKLPEGFNEDPGKWRLRWNGAAIHGYTPNNYRWEKVHRGPVEAQESWNQIAQVEEIKQQFPFEELGLTPAEYVEALIGLGMLIADVDRVGDDMLDLIKEAINTVKGRTI